jgi:hypothetical protein
MALFLSENVNFYNDEASLNEQYISLLQESTNLVSEVAELNESILRADFIIHEQGLNLLSEEEKAGFMQKTKDFAMKSGRLIKEKAIKIWNFIKRVTMNIVNKVKMYFNKIRGKGNVTVKKASLEQNKIYLKYIPSIIATANNATGSIENINDTLMKLETEYKKAESIEGTATISESEFKSSNEKCAKLVETLLKVSESIIKRLDQLKAEPAKQSELMKIMVKMQQASAKGVSCTLKSGHIAAGDIETSDA